MTHSIKRISIFIIALALCFILIACTNNSDSLKTNKNKIIDISTLPTCGNFTAGGYSQDTKVLNFLTGGENDNEAHTLGEYDLRQYNTIIVYYGNDSQATDVGRLALQTVSGNELASVKCELASNWQDTTTKAEIDISLLRNKEEIMLCLKDFVNGIVVYKIEFVYNTDIGTRLPYDGEKLSYCGNGSDLSTFSECDYNKYMDAYRFFTDNGFTVYNQNEKNGNYFTTLTRNNEMIHVYWIDFKDEISVIYSSSNGANLPMRKPLVTTGDVPTTITQLKGNGDDVMGYVIQLADGSFLLYDGGTADCAEELLETLDKMKKGNEIIVRGWVLTVNDEAHIGCFKEIASKHSANIKLETVFAAPANKEFAAQYNKTYLSDGLSDDVTKFEGAKICYVHTGMDFEICNVKLEILFTPEEIYASDLALIEGENDLFTEEAFGSTSLISRVSTKNTKVLMLSDCSKSTATRLATYYSTYLKSDICQAGQHGKGDIPLYIYNMISAPVIYYPTTTEVYNTDDTNKVVREMLLKNPATQRVVLLDSDESMTNIDNVISVPENTELIEAYQCTYPDGEIQKYYFDVTQEEMLEYAKKFIEQGYEKYMGFTLGENLSLFLVKDSEMIHICWYKREKRMTVLTSEKGADTLPVKKKLKKGNFDTSVKQLKSAENDGMGYVVQLADGSFVIYDGGNKNDEMTLQLWNILDEMTPEDKPITIRTWIITTPKIDHYGVFSLFSEKYASKVVLERVMIAPVPEHLLPDNDGYMQSGIKEDVAKFEGAKICNLFPGMAFEYCDVAFEIFETYQDSLILSSSKEPAENISIISRIQTVSAKMLILSDAGADQIEHMAVIWGNYIRSDICQASKNGRGDCPVAVYKAIHPNIVWYTCKSEIEDFSEKAAAALEFFKNSKYVDYIFFHDSENKATLVAGNGY